MTVDIRIWLRSLAAAGGVALAILLSSAAARAQTLPITGRTSGVGGVREQDEAARRTANALNRDARQEAREAALSAAQGNVQGQANTLQGQVPAQAHGQAQGFVQDANAQGQFASTLGGLNGMLRGADLGVQLANQPGAGLTVSGIANNGVVARAGLRQGDRIVSINGTPITTEAQFLQALRTPGSQGANILVFRNGQQQTLSLSPSALTQTTDGSVRTAMRPGVTSTSGLTTTPGVSTTPQTGSTTVNQIDRSGLNTTGTVAPATSGSITTTAPGTTTGTALPPSAISPSGTTANPPVPLGTPTPTPGNPTSPSLLVQPNVPGGGVPTATPGAPTATPGVPTALPSITTPAALPPITTSGSLPNLNGTTVGGLGTSGLSPANPAVPAFGSAGATGATGTLGGSGSTAGGVGAVGGTGAMSGGAGSTAGPGGGRAGATGAPGGAGGLGAGGSGAGASGAGGGAGGGGGAAAGGT